MRKPQVDSRFYKRDAYSSKKQFISYWHQINVVMMLKPENVLEIGIGTKFTSSYLRDMGFEVTTMDLDEDLGPDIIGDITNIPIDSKSFDLVACFEVLEHLRYEEAVIALNEVARVANRYAVLSLPDASWYFCFGINMPRYHDIEKVYSIPRIWNRSLQTGDLHYWEIGRTGYTLKRVTKQINDAGLKVLSTYRAFERPYHRFFVLAPS